MPGPRPWLLAALVAALFAARLVAAGTAPSPAEARLENAVVDFVAQQVDTDLRPDAALRAVAREHSEVLAAGGGIASRDFLRQSESAHGLLDPFPYVFYGSAPGQGLEDLGARLLGAIARLSGGEKRLYTHVAVGICERRRPWYRRSREPRYHVTVLLSQRAVSFTPWPQELRPGERFLFAGEVHPPFREPELLLTRPDGSTAVLADLALEPRCFRAYVAFDHGPGAYQLEIMGRYDLGPRVLGLCTLQAHDPGQSTAYETVLLAARAGTLQRSRPLARIAAAPPASEREAELRLLHLVNRDRQRSGLGPLTESPELAALARTHAADMRDHAFFAHVSPRAGSLAERARAAGIRYRRLAENIAVDRDVDAAETALLHSPGHRLNLLSPDFTQVGVGVAFERNGGGERRVFVTQSFALPSP